MTLAKARQLLEVQASFGGGYNRNGARLILAEVVREHGRGAADALVRELRLTERFGIVPEGAPASGRPESPTQSG